MNYNREYYVNNKNKYSKANKMYYENNKEKVINRIKK